MRERLHKVLANVGIASRRDVEQMVLDGRVEVNGKVVTKLPVMIDPSEDHVLVDGEVIKLASARGMANELDRVYWLMHKPAGVYSTNEGQLTRQGPQTRAIDLLPPHVRQRVYPVGRLDAESRGLLILTNDGELTQKLTHPKFGVAKTYRARVEGRLEGEAIEQLRQGVWLANEDGKAFKVGAVRIRVDKRMMDKTILEITLGEGRNRQVRRMLAKAGHKVRDLTRIKMGPLSLGKLKPGQCRELTPKEVKQLYAAVEGGRAKPARSQTTSAAKATPPAPKKPEARKTPAKRARSSG